MALLYKYTDESFTPLACDMVLQLSCTLSKRMI